MNGTTTTSKFDKHLILVRHPGCQKHRNQGGLAMIRRVLCFTIALLLINLAALTTVSARSQDDEQSPKIEKLKTDG
jgi:hypothetical protein